MKKVWKYISITFMLILGLLCVGVLYLFFVPNAKLFNITYINLKTTQKTENFDSKKIHTIELNSRSFAVSVIPSETDDVYAEVFSNSFGFVQVKNSTTSISADLTNYVLTINVTEPHGFSINNNSYVKLFLPKTKSLNLKLSNQSAETTLNSEALTINNLTYETQKGDFFLKSANITGDMNLSLKKSTFTILETAKVNNNNVKLSLSSGKFYAKNTTLRDVTLTSSDKGVIEIKECKNFTALLENAGGNIKMGKVQNIHLTSSDTNINITEEVTESATISLTKTGKININKISKLADNDAQTSFLSTNSGNLSINSSIAPIVLNSQTGKINILDTFESVNLTGNDAKVLINFNENANNALLYGTINNGSINATNVTKIGLVKNNKGLKITGSGSLNLTMSNVITNNEIMGEAGNVNLVINKDSQYTLLTQSSSGSVRVNLTQISEYGGYTDINEKTTNVNIQTISSTNNLTVKSSTGHISILDTNFA